MFYVNNRFGVKSVFQDFLGMDSLRIPGEIQHGYWSEKRWVEYIEKRIKITPMFLWGGDLEKIQFRKTSWRVNYIGDPWFYIAHDQYDPQESYGKETRLIPSFQKQMKFGERFNNHANFIRECVSLFGNEGVVSLHPAETNLKEIFELYRQHGFRVEENLQISDPYFLHKKARDYLTSARILTDYVGPHVFRASSLDVPVVLLGNFSKTNPYDAEVREAFTADNLGKVALAEQKELSLSKLGYKNVRSSMELARMFHSDPIQQKLLEALYVSKEAPIKIRNLFRPNSELHLGEGGYSNLKCPHCYGKIQVKFSRVIVCIECWASFVVN